MQNVTSMIQYYDIPNVTTVVIYYELISERLVFEHIVYDLDFLKIGYVSNKCLA